MVVLPIVLPLRFFLTGRLGWDIQKLYKCLQEAVESEASCGFERTSSDVDTNPVVSRIV